VQESRAEWWENTMNEQESASGTTSFKLWIDGEFSSRRMKLIVLGAIAKSRCRQGCTRSAIWTADPHFISQSPVQPRHRLHSLTWESHLPKHKQESTSTQTCSIHDPRMTWKQVTMTNRRKWKDNSLTIQRDQKTKWLCMRKQATQHAIDVQENNKGNATW